MCKFVIIIRKLPLSDLKHTASLEAVQRCTRRQSWSADWPKLSPESWEVLLFNELFVHDGSEKSVFQEEFPPLSGNAVYSHCFRPPSSVSLCRKTALTAFFILSVCNPEATKELTAGPPPSDPSLFPLHAKDTAKATAIVFMLFILSQDCVVIYTVNNENTL